jgi:hypothetical protein
MITVYDGGYSYNVTVGVGVFNGSLTQLSIAFLQSLSNDYDPQEAPHIHTLGVQFSYIEPAYINYLIFCIMLDRGLPVMSYYWRSRDGDNLDSRYS